jgi:hypothetical protein
LAFAALEWRSASSSFSGSRWSFTHRSYWLTGRTSRVAFAVAASLLTIGLTPLLFIKPWMAPRVDCTTPFPTVLAPQWGIFGSDVFIAGDAWGPSTLGDGAYLVPASAAHLTRTSSGGDGTVVTSAGTWVYGCRDGKLARLEKQ